MKNSKNIVITALMLLACLTGFAQQGSEDFPELKFAEINGAPKLSTPFLVMGSTNPVMGEKHGLSAPALWDWNGDGLKDLLIGEFETTRFNFVLLTKLARFINKTAYGLVNYNN